MSSKRIEDMAESLLYSFLNLYLDNPGTGEFHWDRIENYLPNKRIGIDGQVVFRKEDFENNMPEIMRELNSWGVKIVRKGMYYIIINIKDVVKSEYERNPKHFNKPLAKIENNKEFWLGKK